MEEGNHVQQTGIRLMPTTVLFTAFIAAGAALACIYYFRWRHAGLRSFTCAFIRLLMLTSLVLAFYEPALHFTRFSTTPPSLAVLVDASQSMRLFTAQQTVSRFLEALNRHAGREGTAPARTSFFCFGDSLRRCRPDTGLIFSDRHSEFPRSLDEPEIRNAQYLLIVSDGNWSTIRNPGAGIGKKNCSYLVLPLPRYRPFIRMTASVEPASAPVDSPVTVSLFLYGYKQSSSPLEITGSLRGRQVWRRIAPVDSGFFSDTLHYSLPSSREGTYVYSIVVRSDADSLFCAGTCVSRITQAQLSAACFSGTPSLDQRFLALALSKRNGWKAARPGGAPAADVAFFFEWNDETRGKIASLPVATTAVLVGCVPCDSADTVSDGLSGPRAGTGLVADTVRGLFIDLPPPARVLRCVPPPPRVGYPMIWVAASARGKAFRDTVPVLLLSTVEDRRILVLAAGGIWRWDFWPLSLGRLEPGATFSDVFLEQVRELALANKNRSFLAYIENAPVYDTDSLHFRLVLPATVRFGTPLDVRFTITGPDGDTAADTLFAGASFGAGASRVALGPVAPGTYGYACSIRWGSESARHDDTLFMLENNTELTAAQQNTLLLGELGAPVSPADTAEMESYLASLTGGRPAAATRRQTIHIRQSAVLLSLVFMLLAAEWWLRKRWRMD
jgi:hypothetical protein